MPKIPKYYSKVGYFCLVLLSACGGSESAELTEDKTPVTVTPPITTYTDIVYDQPRDVARFLTQASFGPTSVDINGLLNQSLSQWYLNQVALAPSYLMPVVTEMSQYSPNNPELSAIELEATTIGFWRNAISGQDQLRQRVAFALSEILVVSNGGGEVLTDIPLAVAYYQDLLIEKAFGNYRDILDAVTYSPAMGYYLTYLGSEKGDPATGRMPDENYARELLQLFTIGVVELNKDGTAKTNGQGQNIETYSNQDITGLARVFTGLNINETLIEQSAEAAFSAPMQTFDDSHSMFEKKFLGNSIAKNTNTQQSIKQALDHIFAHDNLAPFIGKQLIQRLITSNPSAEYVERVSTAFEQGIFQLPNGDNVGENQRGDLKATIAAILFDQEARTLSSDNGGKIREPIIRFTNWARAFQVANATAEYQPILWDTTSSTTLNQHPYRSPSVFNFFRPGYVAPGTASGNLGLNAPELQIVNASSIAGYTNFMTFFIFHEEEQTNIEEVSEIFAVDGIELDANNAVQSFVANYSQELALANDLNALIDHLDLLLTYGSLSTNTRTHITNMISQLPQENREDGLYTTQLLILMIMTSPDYLVQQ